MLSEIKMNKGKIYKLVCNQTNKIYYGSTTQTLMKRRDTHRQHYKRHLKGGCNYITAFEILKNDDFKIELVEDVLFTEKKELTARERHHIQNNECVNKVIPLRTDKEYYLDNKERLNQKGKEHYQNNKDQYRKNGKQWEINNPEKTKEIKKRYKDKIGIYTCLLCGRTCKDATYDIKRHNLTKIHLDSI